MDIQKSNYEYPKFSMIFGYPKMDILKFTDFWISKNELWISKNRIMDILNSVRFLDIQKCILGYPKRHWFSYIQDWIMDIQNSEWLFDIQK